MDLSMAFNTVNRLPVSVASSCISICGSITQQLLVAKHNKKETASLGVAVECIQAFLCGLQGTVLSNVGVNVLGKLQATLLQAHQLLQEVANTGPLMALLKAMVVRDEFLRLHRDLSSIFAMLTTGEQLLALGEKRVEELHKAERALSSSKAEFFLTQEQISGRLLDIATAAQKQGTPEELLHKQLLEQLSKVPDVADLSPDELLSELHALQLAAMYGADESKGDVSSSSDQSSVAGGPHQNLASFMVHKNTAKGKKLLGNETEEFLVQQLCAALTPRTARAGSSLAAEAGHKPPESFICPISKSIMVNPVIIATTGQTYEESSIKRWLAVHNTCPTTNMQLSNKQLVPNYNLKYMIHSWAREHGVRLSAAPHYVLDSSLTVAGAEPSESSGHQSMGGRGEGSSGRGFTAADMPAAGGYAGVNKQSMCCGVQCTLTRWALCLIAIVAIGFVAVVVTTSVILVSNRNRSPTVAAAASATSPQPSTDEHITTPWGVDWLFDKSNQWTRKTAEDYCIRRGVDTRQLPGRLATIDSADKTALLVDKILKNYQQPVYIGLTGRFVPKASVDASNKPSRERELKRLWKWDSGAAFSYANWGTSRNSSNYQAWQPDGYGAGGREIDANDTSCVSAIGSHTPAPGWVEQDVGSWHDHPCSYAYAFLCELPHSR